MLSFKSRIAHAIAGLLLDNGEKLMGSGECVKPWVLERREATQKYKEVRYLHFVHQSKSHSEWFYGMIHLLVHSTVCQTQG